MSYSQASSFAIKDPGQNFNLKAIVGQEQNDYNSFIKVNFNKKSFNVPPGILSII